MENGFAEGYAVGRDNNNNNNGYGFGGWGEWIWIIVLFALWQNGGFGFGGGFGGGQQMTGYEIGKLATTNDVASGFSTSTIMSTQRDTQLAMQQGFSDVQQTLCQGFSGINQSLLTGFHGVDNALCTLGYQTQAGFNSVSNQIASCCCDVKQLLLENRYLNEKQTCDIIQNATANTQRIVDMYTSDKIAALQSENAGLKAKLSNEHQTADIVAALSPKAPIPAYPVFPATSFAYPTGVSFGVGHNNNGCGCGTGFGF